MIKMQMTGVHFSKSQVHALVLAGSDLPEAYMEMSEIACSRPRFKASTPLVQLLFLPEPIDHSYYWFYLWDVF